MHALEGLACRARVTPACSHAAPVTVTLGREQPVRLSHCLRQRHSISRTLLFDAIWRKLTVLADVYFNGHALQVRIMMLGQEHGSQVDFDEVKTLVHNATRL